MPLYNIDGEQITKTAHDQEYQAWRNRLSDEDYQTMADAVNNFCDRCENTFCTSWMPGSDSEINAAFTPFTEACRGDEEMSGLFFGNIVWRIMMERGDDWCFIPAEQDGDRWKGVTYFRRQR